MNYSPQALEMVENYEFIGHTPMPHQLEMTKFLISNKKNYLFSSIGTGKSAGVAWAYDCLMENKKIGRVLIVCPLSLVHSVWVKEINFLAPNRSVAVAHGTRAKRLQAFAKKAHFTIINTDGLRNYKDEIIAEDFDVLVIDEVIDVANHTSQRTKAAMKIAEKCRGVCLMTGSPGTSVLHTFSMAKICNPERLPTKYVTRFKQLFMRQISEWDWQPIDGWTAHAHRILQPAIRFSLESVMPDLPPMTIQDRHIAMTAAQKKVYNQVLKEQVAEFEEGRIVANNASTKWGKLLQITSGSSHMEDGEIVDFPIAHRMNEVMSVYHESGNKLVIFAQFRRNITRLQEFLESKKISVRCIHGDVNTIERKEIIDLFQDGDLEVVIVHPKIGSSGLTLTASHTILLYGPVTSGQAWIQLQGRIRRISQTKPQCIVRFYSTQLEKKLYDSLDDQNFDNTTLLNYYKTPEYEK